MGFSEAVRTVVKQKYATFSGRASRSEFWWFQLFYWVVMLVVAFSAGVVSTLSNRQDGVPGLIIALAVVGGLFAIAMFLPALSVQVRRFHDRNMSGWWLLLLTVLNAIPYIGFISAMAMIVITVLRGEVGPNKFGPDPLRPEARAEVFA